MKLQTIMFFCIGTVQIVAGLETLQYPGILFCLSHVGTLGRRWCACKTACPNVGTTLNMSAPVSTSMRLNVYARTPISRAYEPPFSTESTLLIGFRWYSNVFTPNARLLNLAPPSTWHFRHALILGWMPLMPCLLSSATKVYVSVAAQAMDMYQVIFLYLPSNPWLVVLSALQHTSVLVRHALPAASQFTHELPHSLESAVSIASRSTKVNRYSTRAS